MNSNFWIRIPSTFLFLLFLCLQIDHSKSVKKAMRNRMLPKMRPRPNQLKNTYYPQRYGIPLQNNPSMVELHNVQNAFIKELPKIQSKERGNSFWLPTRSLFEHGMGTEKNCENGGFTRQCGQRLNEDVNKIDHLGMKIINRNPLVRTKFIKIRKMQMRMKRRKRSPVAGLRKADECQRMQIRMKNIVKTPGTIFKRLGQRITKTWNKNKMTSDLDLTAVYFGMGCTKLLRANSKEMMPNQAPMIRAYRRRRRRKREIIFEGENSLDSQIRSKRENTNQDAVGPPISKMRFTTHSLPPENYYYDSRQNDPMARQRSQSVMGQMDGGGDGGDAEVEHESSHDHKYANDVNPDGSTKVNLHTTGMDKFKYSGDGMPPAYGMSSYGHRYSGMPPSSSMRYPGHSTRNNMKVRFDDPRYGISMNAQHKFNARHSMPMMSQRQKKPPMVMRRPAIPSKMRMSRGPIYHGGYQGTYHGGPGYSGNSHSDYHHQIGPRYQHSFHNSHNVNRGGGYYDYYDDGGDSDEDDSSDEDSDDEEDDFDGMGHNYRMKHGTYYSHSNGPGYHRSHLRVQHNIQMGGNPFMDAPRRQPYYPPPKKRSGNFVGKLVATIFVILFLMIIIL